MARYDEDLHENPFFNTLVTKYSILFSEAAEKKWMVSWAIRPQGRLAARVTLLARKWAGCSANFYRGKGTLTPNVIYNCRIICKLIKYVCVFLHLQIFVPRADSVTRLKLNKTDFENHIFRQSGGDSSTTLISCNGKVRYTHSLCIKPRSETYIFFSLENKIHKATTNCIVGSLPAFNFQSMRAGGHGR